MDAIGIDADNSMYPIVYAAVASECAATKSWFLKFLGEDLEIANSHTIAWITDKKKGLIDAVKDAFLNFEHCFCIRHLYNKFKVQAYAVGYLFTCIVSDLIMDLFTISDLIVVGHLFLFVVDCLWVVVAYLLF